MRFALESDTIEGIRVWTGRSLRHSQGLAEQEEGGGQPLLSMERLAVAAAAAEEGPTCSPIDHSIIIRFVLF